VRSKVIGHSLPRLEDPCLVRGKGQFIGDLNFPHQLHMRVVRSPIAHGKLLEIRIKEAEALDGVYAVWTARDISGLGPIDFREGKIEKLDAYRQPVLARDFVRYVGEPVAVVFAEDAYRAEDAADLVGLNIEELNPVVDAFSPPGDFGSGLSTAAATVEQGFGDVDTAFASAYKVVELDLKVGRHSAVPLETRGAIGRYDEARDVLELHGAAKVPHKNRESLAHALGRSPTSLHLYEYHVGGGFGVRGEIYPEDILVLLGAQRFGRPVKWIEDRREHLMSANQSREQRHHIRAAVDSEGRLLAIDTEFWHDQGAYPRTHAMRVAETTCGVLLGPYKVKAYRARGHYRLTNKTPAATYRAPGRYESNFVRERLLDTIAHSIGISRIEIRRRNLIKAEEMPYFRDLNLHEHRTIYDTGDYEGLLDRSLTAFGWDGLQVELSRRRAAGEIVGAGFAVFVEQSGVGPSDGARVNVDASGIVEVITGGTSVGQGFETSIAQVCAEALGCDYRSIRVVHGRTDRIEFGIGAHATRATVMTANAVAAAARNVRVKALEMAGILLQAEPGQLDILDGRIVSKNARSGPSIDLGSIAQALKPSSKVRGNLSPGLCSDGWFDTDDQVYPYGNQFAVVSVDRETGAVKVEKYLIAYDVGRAVNPKLVRGQLVGGFAQGLGGALYEEFIYNESGEPLSVSFADYLLPTCSEVPQVEVLLTEDHPTPRNPLGIKGAGEGGIAPVGAVIASAIEDALQLTGTITQIPLSPQKVKRLMEDNNVSLQCRKK